jgi:hypothetical protein
MDNTGYRMEYYEITSLAWENRPSDASPSEQLTYVKTRTGTGSKKTYWTSSFDNLLEKLKEVSGHLTISKDLEDSIKAQYITTAWSSPGLFNPTSGYWFFHIENNNNK